jgi:hypothetical protein
VERSEVNGRWPFRCLEWATDTRNYCTPEGVNVFRIIPAIISAGQRRVKTLRADRLLNTVTLSVWFVFQ